MKTLRALIEIHKTGLCHRDFAERNVVIRNHPKLEGRFDIRVVDFELSGMHDCHFEGDDIGLNDPPPKYLDFGCHELFDACWSAEVWLPSTFIFRL